jgi:hypothetical protein
MYTSPPTNIEQQQYNSYLTRRTSSMKLTLLLSSLGLASTTLAGFANVQNNCGSPFSSVYLFSVTPASVSTVHNITKAAPYVEPLQGKGIVLKITNSSSDAALYNGSALTQFQYTVDGDMVYYALADTGGDLFAGKSVVLAPSSTSPYGGCQTVNWTMGSGPSAVYACPSGTNLTLTLC